jgi:hypothetical protein
MNIALLLGAAAVGLGFRALFPRTPTRGLSIVTAIGLLFFAYSPPAAASAAGLPDVVLAISMGLLVAGALGTSPVAGRPAVTGITIAYFGLALVVTWLNLPAGLESQAQFTVLAVGALLTSRRASPNDRRATARGIVAIAVAEAVLAAWELIVAGRPLFWTATSDDPVNILFNPLLSDSVLRMAGTTGHPIVLGVLLTVAIALVLTTPRTFGPAPLRVGILAALALGELASGTRSALIAIALIAVYAVCSAPGSSRPWRVLVAAVGAAVGATQLAGFVQEQTTLLLSTGSWTNRAGSLDAAPDLITERPVLEALFGSGWGSESSLFDRGFLNQNGFGIVDNQFVTSIATLGLVGGALLVALLVAAWRSGGRTTRAALIGFVCMAFAFDFMRWAGVVVLLFAILPDLTRSSDRAAPARVEHPHMIGTLA